MNKLLYYLTGSLLLPLLLWSCSESDYQVDSPEGVVDVSFALEIPAALDVTRAYDDNSVRTLDLLVFNASDQFVERIRVNAISGAGVTKTFSARLTASSTQRTIHIIANARAEDNSDVVVFSHITAGTTVAAAIAEMTSKTLTAGQSPALPLIMWGRVALPSITSSTTIGTAIPMLRMSASMYMKCDTPTPANGLNNFTFTGFSVVNASNSGRVAPSAHTTNAATPSVPTLPSGVSTINYAVNDNNTWALATAGTTSEFYLYEKANTGSQSTDLKLIIRGSWNGTTGYYPVWLSDGSAGYVNVVRNHRYCVTIKGCYGTGYATLAEAISATPSANLLVIDTEDDITDIITDGQYKLGISSNKITVSGSGAKNTGVTVLKTNASHTLNGTSTAAWITNITFTAAGTDRWSMAATFGSTTATRTGVITVRAGSLTRTVEVTQSP